VPQGRRATGSAEVPERPMIKLGLRRLRRDDSSVQLGLDPERAVVITGLDEALLRWLDRLDGSQERSALLRAASAAGIGDAAGGLLDLLAAGGVLDDASAEGSAAAMLPLTERERLRPDVASLALRSGRFDAGTGLLARRRQAAVEVRGAGRVGASVATLLAGAGIGHLAVRDSALARAADAAPAGLSPGDVGARREIAVRAAVQRAAPGARPTLPAGRLPHLVLLAPDGPLELGERDGLLRAGVPHLLAAVRETTGIVGPLVLPGRSACLTCLDLTRTDRDPAWPRIAAQAAGDSHVDGETPVRPCDTVLATAVAVHAALQALAFLDGELPVSVNGTLEVTLPEGQLRRRSWTRHPACGCAWADTGWADTG
jgi:hypothetical protein